MSEPSARQTIALLAACWLFYLALSFQAWGWPALDGYPAMERWVDPAFLTSDFYTNTTAKFGVDTPQAAFFGAVHRLTGMRYDVALAVLTALRHLAWPFVLFGFLAAWSGDRTAALIGVVLGTLALFALPKMLGWAWLWGDGSTAQFAILAVTFAWTQMLRRRTWAAFALLALACLIQPLVSVHAAIMVAAIFLIDYAPGERRAALRSPAAWIAGALFVAVFAAQYLMLTPPAGTRLPTAEYLHILARERHPGDFLPSRFHLHDLAAVAMGTAAIAWMAAQCWAQLRRRPLLIGVLGVYALICLAGWLLVEVWPVRPVIDLIPYRTVILAAPLYLMIVGVFASGALRRGLALPLALLGIAYVLAGPVGSRLQLGPVLPAALLLAAPAAALAPLRLPLPRAAWTLAAVALALAAIPAAWLRRGEMTIPTTATSHPLYAWAQMATPAEARFLVEQFSSDAAYGAAISPQRMRLLGHRAVAASRDYPFAEADIRPWYRTWVVGLDHGRTDRVETATVADLAAICQALPYDYVVRRTPLAGAEPEASFPAWHGVPAISVYRTCIGTG